MGITTVEEAHRYAESKGYLLGPNLQRIVDSLESNGGKCPCVVSNPPDCPCPRHRGDIEENGHCKCRLFLKGV